MTHPVADPLLGRTIAQYEIVSRLGGGGMGVVYKARDRRLDRFVALKFLPQQWSHDDGAKQRFVREAQAASATHHPNICIVHDIATADDGQLFIVMGFCDGPTLKQRLTGGALPLEEALDIATQMADGLAKAHQQKVVHRDIKPGNIILTEDGVRIVDFGLATFVDALQLTAEGAPVGTAAYMSPEQVRGEEADARSDVWAAGIVLYEMLTGHVPFRGTYAEAISYAIRYDAPAPIRAARPEVPEDVEQLVFRALHKDPGVRYPSGRELTAALRRVRGLTVPQELQTTPIAVPAGTAMRETARRPRRMWYAAAAISAVLFVAAPVWILSPVDRVHVAVAPVANQTGYGELDPYRLALTQELVSRLTDSRVVRVLPYERLLQIVRRFRDDAADVSSRAAHQAIAAHSGAGIVVAPVLVRENDSWKARAEIRDPADPAAVTTIETDATASALPKDAAHGLTLSLARLLEDHFAARRPWHASIADTLRGLVGRSPEAIAPQLQTVDAAEAFERGLDAYERLEYSVAREAFGEAAERDSRSPLPLAWRSRVAALMRQDGDAIESADRAARLSAASLGQADRLLVEAVIADVHRDATVAEERYRAMVALYPDEPAFLVELAGFLDRQGRVSDAANTYLRALAIDERLPRPLLELCRLYSPSRANDPALARQRGEQALTMFRELGNLGGEAQALWCLTDVLRVGSDAERRESRRMAERALTIMEGLRYPYGLTRANNYMGVVTLIAERNAIEAVSYWQKTLAGSRETGNRLIESRALMNLGVAYELLGRRTDALRHYRESFALCEALRDQQTAAWNQVNAAAILIGYGGGPEDGVRDAQNALTVFQTIGDKHFEVFAHRMIASYYRHVGRAEEAGRQLALAETIARDGNLQEKLVQVRIDLARLRVDAGDYVRARDMLVEVQRYASGNDQIHARIELARAQTRLGQFGAAHAELDAAAAVIERNDDVGSLPLLYAGRGELAYESNRLDEARVQFERASRMWSDELPEASSVEARAYVGAIDATLGTPAARAMILASLDQARRMKRAELEARSIVLLARIDVAVGRFGAALGALGGVPLDRVVSPELRAQVHHWRAQAWAGQDNAGMAEAERELARQSLARLRDAMPVAEQERVLARPDLRVIR